MWLGLMLFDGDRVILVAYEAHRLFTLGIPAAATPQFVRLLREAGCGGRHVVAPRCGRCAAPLEVPPLDEVACASS